jgi:uncharacterized protein
MPSAHEEFWTHERFALVGHSANAPFPLLSYRALKALGKTVYAVDPSTETVDGDPAYDDLEKLPGQVDAVVLEVPREQTARWVTAAAELGIQRVWIHMKRETPEALTLAQKHGMQVCTGTCAVQYLRGGFPHNVHRMLRKLSGKW